VLVTGARKNEVLSATWEQFDFAAGVWVKPHTMTKQKAEHHIPLSAPARQLLSRLREHSAGSPWVLPGRQGRPRGDLKSSWERICKAARIAGLRVHDLRHSHASYLVSAGFSLPVIARLLGHSHVETSARYAHLFDDPLREATERVGAIISGTQSAEIVPLERRGAMTKQQETEYIPEHYELAWFPIGSGMAPPAPLGRPVCVDHGRMASDPVYEADVTAALIEQLYETNGPAFIARFLAKRLREPSPDRAFLDMVASSLEPQSNETFRLEVVRPRDGRSPTKSINDIALRRAVAECQRALGNNHGSQKKAVKEVAKQFDVSKATVLKAIRSK